jgi:hypothetical protein
VLQTSVFNQLYQLGPIYKVSTGAGTPDRIHVCSAELVNEICNEKLFIKNPSSGGLAQVRNGTGDGLFTALDGEENWGLAHRILMPALGPMSIGNMFEGTKNTCEQKTNTVGLTHASRHARSSIPASDEMGETWPRSTNRPY